MMVLPAGGPEDRKALKPENKYDREWYFQTPRLGKRLVLIKEIKNRFSIAVFYMYMTPEM